MILSEQNLYFFLAGANRERAVKRLVGRILYSVVGWNGHCHWTRTFTLSLSHPSTRPRPYNLQHVRSTEQAFFWRGTRLIQLNCLLNGSSGAVAIWICKASTSSRISTLFPSLQVKSKRFAGLLSSVGPIPPCRDIQILSFLLTRCTSSKYTLVLPPLSYKNMSARTLPLDCSISCVPKHLLLFAT